MPTYPPGHFLYNLNLGIDEVGGMPVLFPAKVAERQTQRSPIPPNNLAPPNAEPTPLPLCRRIAMVEMVLASE